MRRMSRPIDSSMREETPYYKVLIQDLSLDLERLLAGTNWTFYYDWPESIQAITPERLSVFLTARRSTYKLSEEGQEFKIPKEVQSVRDLSSFLNSQDFRVSVASGYLRRDFWGTIDLELDRWTGDPILKRALEEHWPESDPTIESLARDLLLNKPLTETEKHRLYSMFKSGLTSRKKNPWLSLLLLRIAGK